MRLPASQESASRLLDRPPKAEARSVESMVRDILDGRIRIPGWQRRIKWEIEDARKLMDSLYRGYPIGTLLLWQRRGPDEHIEFGSVSISAQARSDALYVVDGQQRLTSMVRVLAGAGVSKESFALCFDLDSGAVITPDQAEAGADLLPMTEVLDSRRLIQWLLAHPAANQDRAIELGKRIREYTIPLYVVESDEERAVREIFERTNDTGKQLDANEVFDGRFRGLDGVEPAGLRDVADGLAQLEFGRLDEGELHTMMMALRFTDVTKADTSRWSPAEAHQALVDLQASSRCVVSFLRRDAAIPHRSLLPYAQPLLTLTRLFHFFPSPHPRNRILLARWLWRGASAGLHGGATVGTRATLKAIVIEEDADVAIREDESVQALLDLVEKGRSAGFEPVVDRFSSGWASGKLSMLALFALDPRHLIRGDELPLNDVRPRPVAERARLRSSLGNRVLHPAIKGGLRRAIRQCDDPEVLASHAILPEDVGLLEHDVDAFIAVRQGRLAAAISRFVDGHTRWRETDRPPLRALWDDGDGVG